MPGKEQFELFPDNSMRQYPDLRDNTVMVDRNINKETIYTLNTFNVLQEF